MFALWQKLHVFISMPLLRTENGQRKYNQVHQESNIRRNNHGTAAREKKETGRTKIQLKNEVEEALRLAVVE